MFSRLLTNRVNKYPCHFIINSILYNVKLSEKKELNDVTIYGNNSSKISEKSNDLYVTNSFEIRNKNSKKLLARFSSPVENVMYFNAKNNILFSTDSTVHVCDNDFNNCHFIAEKDPLSSIVFHKNLEKLFYKKNDFLFSISFNLLPQNKKYFSNEAL